MGAQGYQSSPLYKPGVGENVAFHAAPADRTSIHLVSAASRFAQPHLFPNFSNSQQWDVSQTVNQIVNCGSNRLYFLSSMLTGRKTSSRLPINVILSILSAYLVLA